MAQKQNKRLGNEGLANVLVVAPLNSIINDQILDVNSMGISACNLAEHLSDLSNIMAGKYGGKCYQQKISKCPEKIMFS